jgi:hypothetical protein
MPPVLGWDPSPYPDPRRDRGAGLGALGLEVFPPTTRVWTGHFFTGAVARLTTLVSPRFIGPAVLRSLRIQHQIANQVAEQSQLLLLVSSDGSGAGQVAWGQPLPSGVSISTESFQGSGTQTANTYRNSLWVTNMSNPTTPIIIPLNYLVQMVDFFVKLCYTNPSGAGVTGDFGLTVSEQIDPNTLVDLFTGV